MYDNDDEFGIDGYREDLKYVYEMNKIAVNRYKRKQGEDNPTDGDFIGLSSTDSNIELIGEIDVNINSVNLRKKDVEDSGRNIAGIRVLSGIVPYDSALNNGDIIEFTKNRPSFNLVEGEKFSVSIEDIGPLKGQFCFKKFEAFSIGDEQNISEEIWTK